MVKCMNCEYPLICGQCDQKFAPAGRADYEAFHDRLTPVVCPGCGRVLTCKYCGHVYDAGEYEYQSEDRQ